MARGRRTGIGLTMAVLLGAAAVALGPSPASACSFAAPNVSVEGEPSAGGTLEIHGTNWFYAPHGVDSMCRGQILPIDPVTVVVRFETLSGPRSIALVARVTAPAGDVVDQTSYAFDTSTAIPPDAASVELEASGEGGAALTQATISGAVATTVPVPPTAPRTAAPANAVAGSPTFTG